MVVAKYHEANSTGKSVLPNSDKHINPCIKA